MFQKSKQFRNLSLTFTGLLLLLPALASAHVIVTPGQAGVAQELVFNVSSPNERQTAISTVKLVIPGGVSDIVPTVKDGWNITTTTNGSDTTSITWSGGQIPVGQRTDFSFSAQLPSKASSLNWKAYQTYADGTVVHWDQTPTGSDDSVGNAGPYSQTKVVDDLNAASTSKGQSNTLPLLVAITALVISIGAVLRTAKKPSAGR